MEKITLPDEEIDYLNTFVRKGKKSARELTRAHILLMVNNGRTETEIKDILGISRATVSNVKKRYREASIQTSLTEKQRPGQPKKYMERQEAEIIAQACTESPHGSKRWTLTLLTEEMNKKKGFETINRETIRLILKKAKLNLG